MDFRNLVRGPLDAANTRPLSNFSLREMAAVHAALEKALEEQNPLISLASILQKQPPSELTSLIELTRAITQLANISRINVSQQASYKVASREVRMGPSPIRVGRIQRHLYEDRIREGVYQRQLTDLASLLERSPEVIRTALASENAHIQSFARLIHGAIAESLLVSNEGEKWRNH